MKFIKSTIEEYINSGNTNTQALSLRYQISSLARQERMLKLKCKRLPLGVKFNKTHICKNIYKHARFKKKNVVTHNRYKKDLHQRFTAMQEIVNYYTHIIKTSNFSTIIGLQQTNGMTIGLNLIIYIFYEKNIFSVMIHIHISR